MSSVIFKKVDEADIPTPVADKVAVYFDATLDGPAYKDETGTVIPLQGTAGAPGAAGSPGAMGVPGIDGVDGADGMDGVDGAPGATGAAGADGAPGGGGAVVQVVNTQTGALATGTTLIPLDDTIPQNTEGDEYLTLAITPTDAANKLRIDVTLMMAASANSWVIVALFQDATADAIAAFFNFQSTIQGGRPVTFTHFMDAGTTSATTFKVRAGSSSAATLTLNGHSGGRMFGGVAASSITITEIVP